MVNADTARGAGARLAREAARYASLGWMRATSGNLSEVLSRQPFRLAVTASGQDKGELRAEDVVVVDEAGVPVTVDGLAPMIPSAEAALHARVAARTGAGAVAHVHTVSAVVAARQWPDGVSLRDLEMLKALGRGAHDDEVVVPVIGNSQDMTVLGDRFAQAHDPRIPAIIVAGHGTYVWGADTQQARHRTEALDWLLTYAVRSTSPTRSNDPWASSSR